MMTRITSERIAITHDASPSSDSETHDIPGVLLWAWGDVYHPKFPGGKYTVDDAFADKMLHAFGAMTADGQWLPVILAEHKKKGRVLGVILALAKTDRGIEATFRVPTVVYHAILEGELLYISPTFFIEMEHSHTGEVLEFVLIEASFVAVPHLTNIPPLSQVYAHHAHGLVPIKHTQESIMDENTEEVTQMPPEGAEETAEMTVEQLADRLNAIEAKLDQLIEAAAPVEQAAEVEEDEEVEQTMQARIEALEQSNRLKDAQLAVSQSLPGADSKTIANMAQLKLVNEALYENTIAIHQSNQTADTLQAPLGSNRPAVHLTPVQVLHEAQKEGHTKLSDQLQYAKVHHPNVKININELD